jgi:hypothetical protein
MLSVIDFQDAPLSEVKNLADTDSLDIVRTQRVYARDEILHFVQNDKVTMVRQAPIVHLPVKLAWQPARKIQTWYNSLLPNKAAITEDKREEARVSASHLKLHLGE